MKNKVFIINKSGHDFSDAKRFGDLIYLSEGMIDRYAITSMYREFVGILKESNKDDYILLSGLSSMSSIACSIFAFIHGRLNLLIFRNDRYITRKIVLKELIDLEDLFGENG